MNENTFALVKPWLYHSTIILKCKVLFLFSKSEDIHPYIKYFIYCIRKVRFFNAFQRKNFFFPVQCIINIERNKSDGRFLADGSVKSIRNIIGNCQAVGAA